MTRIRLEVFEPGPTCQLAPSPRSSARCEAPAGHQDDFHAGRTRRGYWKFWTTTTTSTTSTETVPSTESSSP